MIWVLLLTLITDYIHCAILPHERPFFTLSLFLLGWTKQPSGLFWIASQHSISKRGRTLPLSTAWHLLWLLHMLPKQWHNIAMTIIYHPCYMAGKFVLCLEGPRSSPTSLSPKFADIFRLLFYFSCYMLLAACITRCWWVTYIAFCQSVKPLSYPPSLQPITFDRCSVQFNVDAIIIQSGGKNFS